MLTRFRCCPALLVATATILACISARADQPWKKHVLYEGSNVTTVVAGDFTGDGKPDVITDAAKKTRLYVGPDWSEIILDEHEGERSWQKQYTHSECFDVDRDGDLDYIGTQYFPGKIIWLECPPSPETDRWKKRLVDDQIHGIHGLAKADVDGDGHPDLLATSARPRPPFPESLAWYRVPKEPRPAERWERHIFAKSDAPGLTHYLGVGDVNGDGRIDAATGAKGGPQATSPGEWFAWWQAPADPTEVWTKHMISDQEPGATNIHPADINGDGKIDFIASRGHGRGVIWFQALDWKRHDIDANIKEPHALVVVDMDRDGDVDAATCAFGDKVAVWYENDGAGEFTRHVVGTNQESYDIRAHDLDSDGDLDLLIAGRASNNVVWYENPE
jgi:hypothetical protein